eukprot:TRINITY_DN5745_c0_g1_i1.p1 TRINITY_DN5745_c0_g1~~TRINITY_DN5745_c0_g1_i1.p1  ORF type:complete len:180 (+),score=14.94 TRINITY_DN5745_c0_g1_i1:412-951(+)
MFGILILLMIFFQRPKFGAPAQSLPNITLKQAITRHFLLIVSFFLYISLMVLYSTLGFMLLFTSPQRSLQHFTDFLGIFSVCVTIVMWLPQMYLTWRLKSPGTLSLLFLALQAPGSFIAGCFQLAEGTRFQSWLPFFVTGIQQTILLGMCIYYTRKYPPLPTLKEEEGYLKIESAALYE